VDPVPCSLRRADAVEEGGEIEVLLHPRPYRQQKQVRQHLFWGRRFLQIDRLLLITSPGLSTCIEHTLKWVFSWGALCVARRRSINQVSTYSFHTGCYLQLPSLHQHIFTQDCIILHSPFSSFAARLFFASSFDASALFSLTSPFILATNVASNVEYRRARSTLELH